MRAGKSLDMAYFGALGSNSDSINSLIFLGLGFLVCKMGQRCPLSKLGVESTRGWMWQDSNICSLPSSPPSTSPRGPLLPTTLVSSKGLLSEWLCLSALCGSPLAASAAPFITRLFLRELCSQP